jgi:GntR family transcriptional regulator
VVDLNVRDVRPIYEQVRDGLRQKIISGELLPGEKLPSVRALATMLTINPNTIQRAYEALEKDGYIYTLVGKGTFAAELGDASRGRRGELYHRLEALSEELLFLGETPETLCRYIREVSGRRAGDREPTGTL